MCREFDTCMLNSGRATTTQDLDKIRQDEFAYWLRKRILSDRDCDRYIRIARLMPDKQVNCYNGFRFHTETYGQNKTTKSSGVCIKGEWAENTTPHEYYGFLQEVIELQYDGPYKVVLFRCHWFDITNGVKVDREHGLVEVKHTSRLKNYEPFILACQANQVCYLPYASDNRERRQWWVVMKTSPKGKFGVEGADANLEFFQDEMPDHPISFSNGQDFNWDDLVLEEDEFELVDDTMELSPTRSHAPQSMANDNNTIEEGEEEYDMEQEFHMEQDDELVDWYALSESDQEY